MAPELQPGVGRFDVKFLVPGQSSIDLVADTPLHDTDWHYIAFTFDGENTLKLYQDGVLVGTAITNGPWPSINTTIELGTSEQNSGMNGQWQMVRISSGVRTSFPPAAFALIKTDPISAAPSVTIMVRQSPPII